MRAVLDVNVLISAAISPRGAPAQVLRDWGAGRFELVASPALIDELGRALAYPKVRRRVPEHAALAMAALITRSAHIVTDPPASPSLVPDDGDDAYLIALAAGTRAVLVTGDRHLLDLPNRPGVMTPRDFLVLLEKSIPPPLGSPPDGGDMPEMSDSTRSGDPRHE